VSDERLREAQRRWEASGARADALAYVRARARAGELSGAAQAAAQAFGEAAASLPPVTDATWRGAGPPTAPWEAWARDVAALPVAARARLLLAPARAAYEVWTGTGFALTDAEWVTAVVWRLEDAALDPARIEAVDWGEAFDAAYELGDETRPAWSAAHAVGHAGRAAVEGEGEAALAAFRLAAAVRGPVAVFERLWAEVVPWLLGAGDPVRARVEARRGLASG